MATLDDAPQVAELLLASRATFLPYAPLAHADDDVRAWVGQVLIRECEVLVAVSGRELTGMLALRREPALLWIDQFYLAPGHTGLGLGSRLLARALAGVTCPVRLHTFQANTGAQRFYERHGFVALSFTDGSFNEERCPDVLYERSGGAP